MQLRRCASTEHALPQLRSRRSLGYWGVNLPETATEKSQSSRILKTPFLLMLMIIVGLAMLAVFANVQRFRRGDVETVVVRPANSPTPSAQGH